MNKYLVKRPKDTVIVAILPSQIDGKYSFVNLTTGHICKCKFDSEEEALKDMDHQIELGNVLEYGKMNSVVL